MPADTCPQQPHRKPGGIPSSSTENYHNHVYRRKRPAFGLHPPLCQHHCRQDRLQIRRAHPAAVPHRRHDIRQRRSGIAVPQRRRSTAHRYGGAEHHPVFRRYGHPLCPHPAGSPGGHRALHGRCGADRPHHRPLHLLALGTAMDEHPLRAAGFAAAGLHHVVDRLGFGLCHPAFTEDGVAAQSAPHA